MFKPIVVLAILILLAYLVCSFNMSGSVIPENIYQPFTALNGMEKPLVTYDDYGTFNYLMHFDDLPYHDSTYDNMSCAWRSYDPHKYDTKYTPNTFTRNEITDSFIEFDGCSRQNCRIIAQGNERGDKVRRSLVPSNYVADQNYSLSNFDEHPPFLLLDLNRSRESSEPPVASNTYEIYGE